MEILTGILGAILGGAALILIVFRTHHLLLGAAGARLELATRTRELEQVSARLTEIVARQQTAETQHQHTRRMEALGRLTAGIAHDFNNLLMAIRGSASMLAAAPAADPAESTQITTILLATERAATLTRQLLAFGREQSLTPRRADMNQVLRGMESLLTIVLGGHGRVELQLAPSLGLTCVDTTQISHAILNLAINARDAMPDGGVVTIRTAGVRLNRPDPAHEDRVGDFVLVAISDTGVGMSEDVRAKAFEPFFTTKPEGAGSGLGLSQVYGLVRQLGGMVEIASQPGKGTTVSMYLPALSERDSCAGDENDLPRPASTPAPTPDPTRRRPRILLLDDDPLARETVEAMLRRAGYTVLSCETVAPALAVVETDHGHLDLLVVDFAMADMRGDQFAARVRQRRPDVPVLFITGHASPEQIRAERWLLNKPFDADLLVATAESAMSLAAHS